MVKVTLFELQKNIFQNIFALESAKDENAATAAFSEIKTNFELYACQVDDLRKAYYQQLNRNSALQTELVEAHAQSNSHRIAIQNNTQNNYDGSRVGEPQPTPSQMQFVRTSQGLINISNIDLADKINQSFYLSSGIKVNVANKEDFFKIFHILQHYQTT